MLSPKNEVQEVKVGDIVKARHSRFGSAMVEVIAVRPKTVRVHYSVPVKGGVAHGTCTVKRASLSSGDR